MEYHHVLLYYARNGTIQIVEDEPSTAIPAAVIILICFLLGVIYNFLVIAAVISDNKLRSSNFYFTILQVTIVCFLDTLTVESFALSFLFNHAQEWCKFSASVFHLFLLMHSLTICFLCFERTLHLHKIVLKVKSCLFGFLGVWIFGTLFTVPTLVMSKIHFFSERSVNIEYCKTLLI